MYKLHNKLNKLLIYRSFLPFLSFIIILVISLFLTTFIYSLIYGVIALLIVRSMLSRAIDKEKQLLYIQKRVNKFFK